MLAQTAGPTILLGSSHCSVPPGHASRPACRSARPPVPRRPGTANGTIYMNQVLSFQLPVYAGTELEAFFKITSKVGRKLVVNTSITCTKTLEIVVEGEAVVLLSKEKSLEETE